MAFLWNFIKRKTFWVVIHLMLTDSLNHAYDIGELSPAQKGGILSLIKKNDQELLKKMEANKST